MNKIAIATAKGGTGKTTIAVNLGAGLALRGKKVLIIDCDVQGNAVNGHFNIDSEHSLAELLTAGHKDCIIEVRDNLDVIASGRERLYAAEKEVFRDPLKVIDFDKNFNAVNNLGYDFALFDFSPTVTFINELMLFHCDYLFIPINPGVDALTGAEQYIDMARRIGRKRGNKVELFGFLVNMYDNTVLSRNVEEMIRENYKGFVFKTKIRRNIAIAEARAVHKTIYEYDPHSHGAEDFNLLTEEVINNGQGL